MRSAPAGLHARARRHPRGADDATILDPGATGANQGLLPALARDLGIAVASAGQLVTLFAVVVMACGPFLGAWLAHVERKRLFIAILGAVRRGERAGGGGLDDLGTGAGAPAARAGAAGVLGTASDTAAQIAGPGKGGRAVSTVYLGISAAMLFGIPLGTLASDAIGWRGAARSRSHWASGASPIPPCTRSARSA